MAEGDGPGKEVNDFQVKYDEKDRDEIKSHIELHARIIEGLETAFISRDLFGVRIADRYNEGCDQERQTDHQCDADEDRDREITDQEFVHLFSFHGPRAMLTSLLQNAQRRSAAPRNFDNLPAFGAACLDLLNRKILYICDRNSPQQAFIARFACL